MSIYYSYAIFCDDNNLKRLGASPEEHLANIDRMFLDLMKLRQEHLTEIASRCPTCGKPGHKHRRVEPPADCPA